MEAQDNVRFMTSIEKYWDPLYRSDPPEITEHIPPLLTVLRSVYNSSTFFNTSERMSSFLSKITNQLIVASQNYLTDNHTKSIWSENMTTLVRKINECKKMQEVYRETYEKMCQEIVASGEKPLTCSPNYLFNRLDAFTIRLCKIREIMEVCLRYEILKEIPITGMEIFLEKIEIAFETISTTFYDPLAYRLEQFDKDFLQFQKEVSIAEMEMEIFVKNYLDPIPTTAQRILTLKRFQKLNLICLKLADRMVDAAELLSIEIDDIKDKYNEERGTPPLGRCVTPAIGKIAWIRSLHKKIEEPVKYFLQYDCIYKHPTMQMCVKMYNFLAPMFLSYESTVHKAWYSYVNQARSKLEVCVHIKFFFCQI